MKQQLGCLLIEDIIYKVNTNYKLYKVSSGKQTDKICIHVFNPNDEKSVIGIWHVKNGDVLATKNTIVDTPFAVPAGTPCDIDIGMLASSFDTIYVKSALPGVNFILWGDEQ